MSDASDSGSGGSPTADVSGVGTAIPSEPVASEVSRRFDWQECGKLETIPVDELVDSMFTPDGKRLVALFSDGSVLTFDLSTDSPLAPGRLRPAGDQPVSAIAVSPDGTLLAEVSDSILLRRMSDGSVAREFEPADPECWGTHVVFSSSGDRFAVYGGESEGCVFQVSDGNLLLRLLPNLGSAAFHGRVILATGCDDNDQYFCAFNAGDGLALRTMGIEAMAVSRISRPVISPAGDSIATAAVLRPRPDDDIEDVWAIWNTTDGSLRFSIADPNANSSDYGDPLFSQTGEFVLLGNGVYRSDDGRRVHESVVETPGTLLAHPKTLSLSPDGSLIATSELSVLDVETGKVVRMLRRHATHSELFPDVSPAIKDLDISAGGDLLVTSAIDVLGWRLATDFEASQTLWASLPPDAAVRVSEDGHFAALSGALFPWLTGVTRTVLDMQTSRVLWQDSSDVLENAAPCLGTEFAFSPDSRLIAGKGAGTTLDVYDTEGFSLVTRLPTGSCAQGVQFSADGAWLHTPDASFETGTWPPPVQREFWQQDSEPEHVYLELSPTGSKLVTSCADGCRSALDEAPLPELDTEGQHPRHPRFSTDGHWIVSGGTLLHVPSGDVRIYNEDVSEALFTPGGDIIAGDRDANILRYCRHE